MSQTPLERVLSGDHLSIANDEILPGTVHLVDLENVLSVKKGSGANSNIILHPQPSDNVNDPLRWSQWKKNTQFSLLWVWCVFLAVTVNWNGPWWSDLVVDLDCTYSDLNITLKTLAFPAVIWVGFVYGAHMMWLSLMASTQSEFYQDIYGFSTATVGLTNLAPLVGAIIGMIYGGHLVDWLSIYLAKKNNGVMEAEYRLYAMVGPIKLNAAGLLAYDLAPISDTAWPVSVILGQGLLGYSMGSTGPISLTYAIECYPDFSSECLVMILFVRSMIQSV